MGQPYSAAAYALHARELLELAISALWLRRRRYGSATPESGLSMKLLVSYCTLALVYGKKTSLYWP